MKIKRFFAKDMRTALKEVKDELGVDAVIMSNKKLANGVEIVAAVDYDKAAPKAEAKPAVAQSAPAPQHNFVKPEPMRAKPEPQAKVADSLQALLERQAPRPRSPELASMFSQSGIDTSEHYQPKEPSFEQQQPEYKQAPRYQQQAAPRVPSTPSG